MLTVMDSLPPGLLALPAAEIYRCLSGPTLVHLEGRREPALFVSVLLHGNEVTGWDAVRQLLGKYQGELLPRGLMLLIANVDAARYGRRHLDSQPDYNRIWLGGDGPEHGMARKVLGEVCNRGVFASVDIHNNTGRNPHYACVNCTDHRFLQLASLFSRTVVYFLRPLGVQSMAMAEYCPAVTLECGKSGQVCGTSHALEFLEACLHLSEIPDHPVVQGDIDLFHTVATVKISAHRSFGFDKGDHDVCLDSQLEQCNFRELDPGAVFGRMKQGSSLPFDVQDEQGDDVGERYFRLERESLQVRRQVVPAMISLDPQTIRDDCLCYLMERYPLPEQAGSPTDS